MYFLIENDDLLEKHNTIRDKRLLALFLVGIIVKDPYHHKPSTRREQDLYHPELEFRPC